MGGFTRFEIEATLPAFQSGCAGKDQYPSESAAEAVLALARQGRLHDGGRSRFWNDLNAYECQFCGSWHVGHSW